MHAITIPEPGGPEALVWAEVPDPEPGEGELLIETAASAVNRADLMQRQGDYPPPKGASAYPGLECSGIVLKRGEGVTGFAIGDRVCALLSGGGYAERVVVPAGQVLPVPAGTDLVDAAALPEVACTVWSNVVMAAHLAAGETLLVHGGGSGIGTFAIQLGRALGATVVTTASKGKHAALRELGADRTIDYASEEFERLVTPDVILDIMGGSYLARNVEALRPDGRLVIIGTQGGRKAELHISKLLAKRGTLIATALRFRPAAQKAEIVRQVRKHVWPLVESGAVRPIVDRRIPMHDAAEAHRVVESSSHLGKVLLVA
ncbi:putative PIG3 family NAD(P)H quinone oxidoreductase [Catenuloplanes nepalensis]|uniref:PIG3 family NAD(P)H quinone oxidoreductase n=1 Tax=Catenuloplanes nepalensis TaxID=587533 RepID=A0ABT9N4I5_9ACTN|nr:NAD(P)H-quinone oxidoreductase [Catenuloplanes nepalensis]MDP9798620.1 putative PIG3 family NAD(P)H quinone oxidoreductase [Catenuloplanes nepalensis]